MVWPQEISILSCSCSPHLEHLSIICRPFYLPREFSSIVVTAVYISPQADTSLALSKLHDVLSGYINKHPDAACIIAGDFNKANLKKVMPNFHQHISCPTRGPNTLDHCYTVQKCLQSPLTAGFWKIGPCRHFPHTGQTKDRPGPRWRGKWRAGPPTLKLYAGGSWWRRLGHILGEFIWRQQFTDVALSFVNMLTEQATETVTIRDSQIRNRGWTEQSVMRLTIELPHTTPVSCR